MTGAILTQEVQGQKVEVFKIDNKSRSRLYRLWLANNENAKGNMSATMVGDYFDSICQIIYPNVMVNGKKFEKYLDEDMEDATLELAVYQLAIGTYLKKELTTLMEASTRESGDPIPPSVVENNSTGSSGNPLNSEN